MSTVDSNSSSLISSTPARHTAQEQGHSVGVHGAAVVAAALGKPADTAKIKGNPLARGQAALPTDDEAAISALSEQDQAALDVVQAQLAAVTHTTGAADNVYQLAQLSSGLASETTTSDVAERPVMFERTATAPAASGAGDWGMYALLGGGLALAAGGGGGGGGSSSSGTSSTSAKVIVQDGLIKNATVYIDTNHDGTYSATEKVGVTDEHGVLQLTNPTDVDSTLIVVGGTNIDTGLPNTLTLTLTGGLVANGTVVVSPLTSLITAVYEHGPSSMTLADAANAVKTALGLSSALDLTTFNPWDASANAADALAVQKAAAQLATVLTTVSGGDASVSQDVMSALATTLLSDSKLDLTHANALQIALADAAPSVTVDWTDLAAATQAVGAATQLSGITQAQLAAATPLIVGLQADTGSSATDRITSDARLVVAGRSAAATLEFSTDGGTTWVAEDKFTPANGALSVQARLHYSDGTVTAASAAFEFTLNTTTPTAPTLALHTDSGHSATDHITNHGDIVVTGQVSGALLQYSLDQVTWSTTLPTLTDGAHDVYARQSFTQNGTVSPVTKLSFTLDTVADAGHVGLATNTADVEYDTGSNKTDGVTSNAQLVLAGQAEAGVTDVSVTLAGVTHHIAATDIHADGSWSLALSEPLADGTYTPVVTVTDAAGNVSAPTSMTPITVDTTPPDVSTATAHLAASSDSGLSSDDGLTNVARPTIEGQTEAHAAVLVSIDGTDYQTEADASGHWSVVVTTALGDGEYTPSVTVTDLAGNVSDAFDGTPFTVQATSPTESTPAGLVQGDETIDTGSSSEDGITNNPLPMLAGTLDVSSPVTVIIKFAGVTYVTQTDDAGEWSLQIPEGNELEDGTYVPGVLYVDDAGNQVHVSGTSVTIDTTAPDASGVTGELVHDEANDTGAASDDNLTSNDAPTIAGTAEAGVHIAVDVGGNVFETDADEHGHWSITADGLSDGDYTPLITITDVAGNVSDAIEGVMFTVDVTAPDAATGELVHDDVSDTGVDTADSITNNNMPSLSGTAEAGASVSIDLNGDIFQTQADEDGNWTVDVSKALADGEYTPTITVTDAAGNVTESEGVAFTIDTEAPDSSSVTGGLTADNDTGLDSEDGITANNAPTVTGTADALALIHVDVGGNTFETQADEDGNWSVQLDALDDGTYTPVITVTDAAGNESTAIHGTAFTIDTTAPDTATGELVHDAANDTGAASDDNLTSNDAPTIAGTAEAGAHIAVDVGGSVFETDADEHGNWSVTADGLSDGEYTPLITVTDVAGNVSDPIEGVAFIVDVTAPDAATGELVHDDVSDTGVDTADSITNNNMPSLSGTAEPGASVSIDLNGDIFQTQADDDGNWTLDVDKSLADGEYTPTITVTDAAGNVTESEGVAFTIDTEAPDSSSVTGGLTADNDTGLDSEDGITANNAPTVTGTADALALIHVDVGGNTFETQADEDGNWSVQLDALDDGTYTPIITVTDAAGNESAAIHGTAFTIDTTAPDASSVTGELVHDAANDTGAASDDNLTSNDAPTIAGTAEAGVHIAVDVGGNVFETDADEHGNWSITADGLSDGEYTPLITITDVAGNVSDPIEGVAFTVDVTLAEFTGGLTHDDVNDTGVDTADNITNNNKPNLSGTAEAGATVVVTLDGHNYTTVAGDDGAWSVDVSTILPDGDYTPTITVTDVAGNTDSMDGESFTVDTVAGSGDDTPLTNQVVLRGDAVDIDPLNGRDLTADDLVEDTLGSLPDGLTIDDTTGHIVGTANAAGFTYITVTSSDAAGNTATNTFQVAVTVAEKSSDASSFSINNVDGEHPKTWIGEGTDQHLNVYSSVGDVLLAGSGDDLFQLFKPESLGFARLDGGDGIDRVNFSGTDLTFDFADWNNPEGSGQVIGHVEAFYFAGLNSSLTVSAADLFHLQSDALDVDGTHQMVRFMANSTNGGTVALDGLTQVGKADAFGADGGATSGASSDKYTKFTGSYTDSQGEHLVELLLQHGLTAA